MPGSQTGFSPYCYGGAGGSTFSPSRRDSWVNETCIAGSPGAVYHTDCDASTPLDGLLPLLANNTLLLDAGDYTLQCGSAAWTLAEAQARGVDVGTVVGAAPDAAGVLALATAFVRSYLIGDGFHST